MWQTTGFTLNRLQIQNLLWVRPANFMTSERKSTSFFFVNWKKTCCGKPNSPISLLPFADPNVCWIITCSGMMHLEHLTLQGFLTLKRLSCRSHFSLMLHEPLSLFYMGISLSVMKFEFVVLIIDFFFKLNKQAIINITTCRNHGLYGKHNILASILFISMFTYYNQWLHHNYVRGLWADFGKLYHKIRKDVGTFIHSRI